MERHKNKCRINGKVHPSYGCKITQFFSSWSINSVPSQSKSQHNSGEGRALGALPRAKRVLGPPFSSPWGELPPPLRHTWSLLLAPSCHDSEPLCPPNPSSWRLQEQPWLSASPFQSPPDLQVGHPRSLTQAQAWPSPSPFLLWSSRAQGWHRRRMKKRGLSQVGKQPP